MGFPDLNPAFVDWCIRAGLNPDTTVATDIDITDDWRGPGSYRIQYTEHTGHQRIRREIVYEGDPPPPKILMPASLIVVDDDHLRERIAETLAHRVETSPGNVIEQPRYDMADAVLATLRATSLPTGRTTP